jgi:hypothetical protein
MILNSVDRGLYIQPRHRKVPRLVFGVAVHVTGLRFVVIRGLYSLLQYVSCVQRLGISLRPTGSSCVWFHVLAKVYIIFSLAIEVTSPRNIYLSVRRKTYNR